MAAESSQAYLAKTAGLHGHWGLSSTFDFGEALSKVCAGEAVQSPLRVLLVHPNDIRHIITTLCRLNRTRAIGGVSLPEIHFYLLENPMDLLARDLLLLELFLDFEVPIRQRANLFLEVYGNLKVQGRTSTYMESLAQRLRQFMAKGTDSSPERILDLSLLNHRQRDELEDSFKLYDRTVPAEIDDYYDHRKRGLYAERYDSRKALNDWDYQNAIRCKASIIHVRQYKEWREIGIAYQFGDQTYSEPNRSLLTYTEGKLKAGKEKGLKKAVRGYWGDIVCSPYYAFGVDCPVPNKHAEGLFEILNKNTGTEQHRHHAVEVALYHMFSHLYELEHDSAYKMTKANDIFSGLGEDLKAKEPTKAVEEVKDDVYEGDENKVEDDEDAAQADDAKKPAPLAAVAENDDEDAELDTFAEEPDEALRKPISCCVYVVPDGRYVAVEEMTKALVRADNIHSCMSRIKVGISCLLIAALTVVQVFPMAGSVKDWIDKNKLQGHFDAIFVSCRAAEVVGHEGFGKLFKSKADGSTRQSTLLAVETAKFLVPFAQKNKQLVSDKIEELATAINMVRLKGEFAMYSVLRCSEGCFSRTACVPEAKRRE